MFMFIFASVTLLLCIYGRKFLRNYLHILNLAVRIPVVSGYLPLIGHVHKFLLLLRKKDVGATFEVFEELNREANEADGVITLWVSCMPMFVLTNPDDIQKAMNCVNKCKFYGIGNTWMRGSVLIVSASEWKPRIKAIQPAFTPKTTLGFLGVFNEESKTLVRDLSKHVGHGPLDICDRLGYTTNKTVYQSAFGINFEWDNDSYQRYQKAFERYTKRMITRYKKLWLHSDFLYSFTTMKKEEDEDMKILHENSLKVLSKAKEMYSRKTSENVDEVCFRPFLESMLQSNSEGLVSDSEMRADFDLIIAAGFETGAASMSLTLSLLGTHPQVQEKLYEELQQVLGSTDRDVTKEDLPKLIYLEAVIKESMRLYPPVPLIARELDRDVQLRNCTLPAGTDVLLSLWGVNRNSSVWGDDVNQFRPERWLDNSVPQMLSGTANFGPGKRGCVGKLYAMLSMKTILAHILRRYKIFANNEPLKFTFNITLHTTEPLYISIEWR